jgi:urease accessory protein
MLPVHAVGSRCLVGLAVSATPLITQAHGLDAALLERTGPFGAGLSHPVLGADHFLAMFAVGLLSAVLGGKFFWRVPAAFVLTMPVGWWLGRIAAPFPPVELGIALSVLALGIASWASAHWTQALRRRIVYAPVAMFALLHGYAHGLEMPPGQPAALYAAGFMAGTAAIHLLGLFVGDLLVDGQRGARPVVWASLALTGAGGYFVALAMWPWLNRA